ncbi:MAG: TetR/AcrR family transcriptional regulator [Gammaproteobacteria bacterium]|nr:MAG: TetR/AcrR family transcriptional regulator [Gammaproteobacteria bacterium]
MERKALPISSLKIEGDHLFRCERCLTVREVARTLGVSVSTLYRHFPGGRSGLDSAV